MQVISEKTNLNFLGLRHFFVGLSILLNIAALTLWFSTGDEKYGVDFRGGTELLVLFKNDVSVGQVREAFEKQGFKEAIIQAFEGQQREFSIRLGQGESSKEAKDKIHKLLQGIDAGGFELLKEDFVGPVIGEQIRKDALWALLFSLVAMLIYIGVRFEWEYGFGALFALFHDVILAAGACLLAGKPMSAGILAALLTITGYSVNDTIIVYDRIRENIAKYSKKTSKRAGEKGLSMVELMNLSVNETLSRTILTALTVFFVVTTLWLFGGGAVADLSFALMIGVIVGTYSSIFIACPVVLLSQHFSKR